MSWTGQLFISSILYHHDSEFDIRNAYMLSIGNLVHDIAVLDHRFARCSGKIISETAALKAEVSLVR